MKRFQHVGRGGSVLVLLLAVLWPAVGEAESRRLLDVLSLYESDGYRFVYSSDLVREDTTIDIDPGADRSIDRLRRGLEAIGLDLSGYEDGSGSTTWYLVPGAREPAAGGLEGRVTDAGTGAALAGVRVEIGGRVAYTDSEGRFRLPEEGAPIRVSRAGYQAVQVSAADRLDALLEISLTAEETLEEVVVVSSRYALEPSAARSLHVLTTYDLETTPEFGDDAVRAANYLPGTASIGLSARPYIRGGLQDETLVVFNNVELLEPFHLKDFQSVFSSFNPSLVDTVHVYTGGFPARYGDRMSGVMDIRPRDETGGLSGDLMLSFLTASAALAGRAADGRASWALSARRGNLDLLLDVLDPDAGSPQYSDYFGSFRYALTDETELEAGFIVYDDDVELKDLDDGDGELGRSVYDNGYGWIQLHRRWSERTSSSTVLSYGRIRNDRSGFIVDEDLEEGDSSLTDERRFRIWNLGHRQMLKVSNRLAMELGGRLAYQSGSYHTEAEIERGVLADLIGRPIAEDRLVQESPSGTSGALYASGRYLATGWLSLEGGLRWDYQDYTGSVEQQVSPRVSALASLGENTELRLSAGRFYQPEQIQELQAADGVSRYQAAQYSDHYIIGLVHDFPALGASLRLEAFDKRIGNPKVRFENLFNSLVLMPELASDRVPVAPRKARARGVEVSLAWRPQPGLDTWMSYTHAYADDDLTAGWTSRVWDQRHTVSAGFTWAPGAWTVAAAVLWHSGWQTTLLPEEIGFEELPALDRNGDRLPHYLSVDLRVSRTWRWSEQTLEVFFELTNSLDRDNVGAFEYDVEENEAEDGYLVSAEPVTLLPRIPSLGVRWRFD
ncbi:MAG: TonB-dependent receptor [Pseudomonadales bacterium]